MKAAGYPCPGCGQDYLSVITSRDIVHILELTCPECGWEWAVER